jgi:CheY-like chemotaxis protein
MIEHQAKRSPVVLVVEDDDLLRLASACELTAEGFETVVARSADEALDVLHRQRDVDAVFTDVQMPGSMNGLALAKQVRQMQPQLYVLITSGDTAPSERLPDNADFVPKPYVLPKVAELLRRRIVAA